MGLGPHMSVVGREDQRMRMRARRRRRLHTGIVPDVPENLLPFAKEVNLFTRRYRDKSLRPDLQGFNSQYHVGLVTNCLGFVLEAHQRVQPAYLVDSTHGPELLKQLQAEPFASRLEREGGFTPVSSSSLKTPPAGELLVAVFEEVGSDDFHFVLYGGKRWYHKPGSNLASDRDAQGKVITDPLKALYARRYNLVGYFWLDRTRSTSYCILESRNERIFVVDETVF